MAASNQKNTKVKQNWSLTSDPQAFGNGVTASSAPATLLKAVCTNKAAGTLWLCFFNSATATGTPAIAPIAVPAGTTVVVDFTSIDGDGLYGIAFSSALTWAASSAAVFSQDSSSSLWVTTNYLT